MVVNTVAEKLSVPQTLTIFVLVNFKSGIQNDPKLLPVIPLVTPSALTNTVVLVLTPLPKLVEAPTGLSIIHKNSRTRVLMLTAMLMMTTRVPSLVEPTSTGLTSVLLNFWA